MQKLKEYVKQRMSLIPDEPVLSERGAYDAYLNVLKFIEKELQEKPTLKRSVHEDLYRWVTVEERQPTKTRWYTVRNFITGKDSGSVYCDTKNAIINWCKENNYDFRVYEWLEIIEPSTRIEPTTQGAPFDEERTKGILIERESAEEVLKKYLNPSIIALNDADYTFGKIISAMEDFAAQVKPKYTITEEEKNVRWNQDEKRIERVKNI